MTTNFEKIKNMTVEEMRDFLNIMTENPCWKICKTSVCLGDASCANEIYKWLQSESEEE